MIEIILAIFIVSFLINFLWEVNHCILYTTCLKQKLETNVHLLTKMSIRDGFWICTFYIFSFYFFNNERIIDNYFQMFFFIALTLIFAYIDELYSIRKHRWNYSKKMPKFFGVGLTPLLELGVTGIISFYIVFMFII